MIIIIIGIKATTPIPIYAAILCFLSNFSPVGSNSAAFALFSSVFSLTFLKCFFKKIIEKMINAINKIPKIMNSSPCNLQCYTVTISYYIS